MPEQRVFTSARPFLLRFYIDISQSDGGSDEHPRCEYPSSAFVKKVDVPLLKKVGVPDFFQRAPFFSDFTLISARAMVAVTNIHGVSIPAAPLSKRWVSQIF